MKKIVLFILFLTSCGVSAMECIHKEQYVDYKWDQHKEFGAVTANEAIKAFHAYPYEEQLIKARSVKQPTFPTISFECGIDKSVLAIWSLNLGSFEVFHLTSKGKKITVETNDKNKIEKLIEIYFSGDRESLDKMMSEDNSAVIASSFWLKLKSIFNL